jgi:hypothetical protein
MVVTGADLVPSAVSSVPDAKLALRCAPCRCTRLCRKVAATGARHAPPRRLFAENPHKPRSAFPPERTTASPPHHSHKARDTPPPAALPRHIRSKSDPPSTSRPPAETLQGRLQRTPGPSSSITASLQQNLELCRPKLQRSCATWVGASPSSNQGRRSARCTRGSCASRIVSTEASKPVVRAATRSSGIPVPQLDRPRALR